MSASNIGICSQDQKWRVAVAEKWLGNEIQVKPLVALGLLVELLHRCVIDGQYERWIGRQIVPGFFTVKAILSDFVDLFLAAPTRF